MSRLEYLSLGLSSISESLWRQSEKKFGSKLDEGEVVLVSWVQMRDSDMILYTLEKKDGACHRITSSWSTPDFPKNWKYVVCPFMPDFIN